MPGRCAGVVPGEDPFYLLENRFQAGGPTTVRGFEQNGLGPQLTEDEGLGGQAVFVMNQELRFPIWKSWESAPPPSRSRTSARCGEPKSSRN